MTKTVTFYFDFLSPFAYLAHHHLLKKRKALDFELEYHPLDLAYVKVQSGNTGPPNRSIPPKIKYLMEDLKRWAAIYKVPLAPPESLFSERTNIGMFIAQERGLATQYASAVWERTWGSGGTFDTPNLVRDVARSLNWDVAEFECLIDEPKFRRRDKQSSDAAIKNVVFRVPSMIDDDQMWWGNDRRFMLESHLKAEKKKPAKPTRKPRASSQANKTGKKTTVRKQTAKA